MPAQRRELEHGCVDWFDYERDARAAGGRLDRPPGRRDGRDLKSPERHRRGAPGSGASR
jgi:hypothetical protein